MAKPIKETPILHGKEAERFASRVENNERRDHSKSFARAKGVYDRVQSKEKENENYDSTPNSTRPPVR